MVHPLKQQEIAISILARQKLWPNGVIQIYYYYYYYYTWEITITLDTYSFNLGLAAAPEKTLLLTKSQPDTQWIQFDSTEN